jgi:hypothetical protein
MRRTKIDSAMGELRRNGNMRFPLGLSEHAAYRIVDGHEICQQTRNVYLQTLLNIQDEYIPQLGLTYHYLGLPYPEHIIFRLVGIIPPRMIARAVAALRWAHRQRGADFSQDVTNVIREVIRVRRGRRVREEARVRREAMREVEG